jgi:hypothetical protein
VNGERLEAEAHFVRYRSTDRNTDKVRVAGLLGLGSDADLPLDSCRLDEGVVAPGAGAGALDVALLDAGTLSIRSGRAGEPLVTDALLEPHHYPELLPFVSGVVYGLETDLAYHGVVPGNRLEIEAAGGEDVGPFVATTSLPRAFPNLVVSRSSAGDVELRWAGLGGRPTDSSLRGVGLELRWAGAKPGALRCRATDDGLFTVSRSLLDGLDAAIAAGQSAQASVAREERSVLDAPSAGRGEVIVTLRDVATMNAQP